MASALPHIIVGVPMGIKGVARVIVETETSMYWDYGAWPAALLCLVDRHVPVGLL